ncbi:hypothetical protein [Winogradskyella sp. UBA3174]|uniref:hypothetical protein n=1 Tax=Winogradskyella sp. UBA3174 TaxID=1947785 RepID=UPI0025EEBE7A|nr:hypothetical protein [Winogradskyella sp. UBA3174]|tara:strand:- start:18937 stop:19131 length:195 start_codon:yes stop_codon:yes gene_type:complete
MLYTAATILILPSFSKAAIFGDVLRISSTDSLSSLDYSFTAPSHAIRPTVNTEIPNNLNTFFIL